MFTLFNFLPPELRFSIWKLSLPGQRWINKFPVPNLPIAMLVCHESRTIALQSYSSITNHPYAYIDWKYDIINADFLGDFESFLTPFEMSRIQNLAIRRFDPDDDNPSTIWQRNPTYRGWPLCAFRFNCSVTPWGGSDHRLWVLDEEKLKSLTSCFLIVPARNQMIFLGGKIMGYEDVVSTMQADLQCSKKLSADSSICSCHSSVHPGIQLVQEIAGYESMRLVDLRWKSLTGWVRGTGCVLLWMMDIRCDIDTMTFYDFNSWLYIVA